MDLRKDAKKDVFRHNIRGIVDQAIRQTNAQYHESEFLDRLDVSLAYANVGEVGWDIFSLDYAITTPLHVVLNGKAMSILRRVKLNVYIRKISTDITSLGSFQLLESWSGELLLMETSPSKLQSEGMLESADPHTTC